MIHPLQGYCFLIEENKNPIKGMKLEHTGFQLSDAHQAGKGIEGVIYAVSEEHYTCHNCNYNREVVGLKIGDRVIFSQFTAESVEGIQDDSGKTIKNLRQVPVASISAFLD